MVDWLPSSKPLPHKALSSAHFFFDPTDCKANSLEPIKYCTSTLHPPTAAQTTPTMIRNNSIRNHQRKILQQQTKLRAPAFSAFARSGRRFGNDISNRNNNNKRPNDAVAKATKNKPGKRVSWSLDTKDPGHYQPLTFATATIAKRNGNRDGNATTSTMGTVTANATALAATSTLAVQKQEPQQNDELSGYQYTGAVDDIDERNKDDPLMATAYVKEMYSMHSEREINTSVKPTYMEHQPHIIAEYRATVIDWLVEVDAKYRFSPETLYLAVNLFDRYLEKNVVKKDDLQMVGVTSLWIASKYEETYAPDVREMVSVCDNTYTKREILDMERGILEALGYQVTVSTSFDFLVRSLTAAHADKEMVCLSRFLLEGTLPNYDLLEYLPSQLACAAVMIARKIHGRNLWSPTLLKVTEYREEDIVPIARALLQAKASETSGQGLPLKAIRRKYASPMLSKVSTVALPAPGDL